MTQTEVRDRRRSSNMWHILDALENVAADCDGIGAGELPYPLAYDVARRARMLAAELAKFRARDLMDMRAVQS